MAVPQLASLAAEAKVNIIAHAAGDKNFVLKDDATLEIEIQTVSTTEVELAKRVANIAGQVAAQVGARAAAAVAVARGVK